LTLPISVNEFWGVEVFDVDPRVVSGGEALPAGEVLLFSIPSKVTERSEFLYFPSFLTFYDVGRWFYEVRAVFGGLVVRGE
jgi:hypothetical protein